MRVIAVISSRFYSRKVLKTAVKYGASISCVCNQGMRGRATGARMHLHMVDASLHNAMQTPQ